MSDTAAKVLSLHTTRGDSLQAMRLFFGGMYAPILRHHVVGITPNESRDEVGPIARSGR